MWDYTTNDTKPKYQKPNFVNVHDKDYLNPLHHVMMHGIKKRLRNGYVLSAFDHTMKFNLQRGFPLLTTKEVQFNLIIGELLWFLEGGKNTNHRLSIRRLNEIDGKESDAKNIWTIDQSNFANKGKAQFEGDCGVIYGSQWRNWNGDGFDQIKNLIHLLKTDPDSRYMKVTAWNPGKIQDMCLPPCHENFQVYTRKENGKTFLDLAMQQRSCDMFLGVPFNIASYALLCHMLAQVTGFEPGVLSIRLLDYHIYLPMEAEETVDGKKFDGHILQCNEQLQNDSFSPPNLILPKAAVDIDDFLLLYMQDRNCIRLKDYHHGPAIKARMSPLFKD